MGSVNDFYFEHMFIDRDLSRVPMVTNDGLSSVTQLTFLFMDVYLF